MGSCFVRGSCVGPSPALWHTRPHPLPLRPLGVHCPYGDRSTTGSGPDLLADGGLCTPRGTTAAELVSAQATLGRHSPPPVLRTLSAPT